MGNEITTKFAKPYEVPEGERPDSTITIVNNTDIDFSGGDYRERVVSSLRATSQLPEELADILKVTYLKGEGDDERFVIDWK